MPSLEQAFGGARHTTSAVDFTLNWAGARVHSIDATASGVDVTLPPATSLQVGGGVFYLVNDGDESFTVKASGGATIATCPVGEALRLDLLDNSSAGGVWASEQSDTDGEPVDPDPPPSTVLATVTAYQTRTGYNLLRGTIPVPEDRIPESLFLRDEDGTAWPTEMHTVIRGPGGIPRVIELRAYVDVPSPGGERHFDVEAGLIESEEVFHNDIVINIACNAPNTKLNQTVVSFSSRLLNSTTTPPASGPVTRTIRRSGELQSSTQSRLFGYDAYITTVAGEPDVWLVDMVLQNGNVGDPSSPLGANILHHVFFDAIALQMAGGYLIKHDTPTQYTTTTHLMAANFGGDAGKRHVIPQGGMHDYRFAIHTAATAARASILLSHSGFFVCDPSFTLWSWSNPATAWYGPAAAMVPQASLSFYNYTSKTYTQLAAALLAGSALAMQDGNSTPLGPYHVRGPSVGNSSGGVNICAYIGADVINTGSVDKLKSYFAVMNMDKDRSGKAPVALCIVGTNQLPVDSAKWNLENLLYVSDPGLLNSNHQGPWPRLNADQWRLTNSASLLPSYYSSLTNQFEAYKQSHTIRGVATTVPLIWLFNDPLAKVYVGHWSAWGHAKTLEYGKATGSPSELAGASALWKSWQFAGSNVQLNPGKGAKSDMGGRIGGWAMFNHAMEWLFADDDKRAGYGAWFNLVLNHHSLAQLPSGSWLALDNWSLSSPSSGDTPCVNAYDQWIDNGYSGDPNVACSQSIECGIQAHALRTIWSCTGNEAFMTLLSGSCEGLWNYQWWVGTDGPYFGFPVRPRIDINDDAWDTPYTGTGPPTEAPDCFYESSGPDNYQIASQILAGLWVDPEHAEAWAALEAMTGETTVAGIISELTDTCEDTDLGTNKLSEGHGALLAWLQWYDS